MAVCKTCIIPDSFPGVDFEDGVCRLCRIHTTAPHVNKNYLGEEKLREVLNSKPTRKYHCLVPLSGGKDSSYMLLYLARTLGLNPLAAHFNSGFINETTRSNIDRICKKLSVDLVVGSVTNSRTKMVQESFKAAKMGNLGGITGIGGICINCENNLRSFALKEARNHDIPFILWGSTDFEDSSDSFLAADQKAWKHTYGEASRTFGLRRLKKIYESMVGDYRLLSRFWHLPFMWHCARHLYYRVRDNMEMETAKGLSRFDPFLEMSFKGHDISVIYFYEYMPYNPLKHIETLNREVGWESIMGKEVRQDCMMHHLANLRHFKRTGITSDGFFYAVLVREGQMDREVALAREEKLKENLYTNAQKTLALLGVDMDAGTLS